MTFKDKTIVFNPNQYTSKIEAVVDEIWSSINLEPVCTSGNDGKHGDKSLHYEDRALDIRFWDVLDSFAKRIRLNLPAYYDVIVEKDHFHIEADPKKEALCNKKT